MLPITKKPHLTFEPVERPTDKLLEIDPIVSAMSSLLSFKDAINYGQVNKNLHNIFFTHELTLIGKLTEPSEEGPTLVCSKLAREAHILANGTPGNLSEEELKSLSAEQLGRHVFLIAQRVFKLARPSSTKPEELKEPKETEKWVEIWKGGINKTFNRNLHQNFQNIFNLLLNQSGVSDPLNPQITCEEFGNFVNQNQNMLPPGVPHLLQLWKTNLDNAKGFMESIFAYNKEISMEQAVTLLKPILLFFNKTIASIKHFTLETAIIQENWKLTHLLCNAIALQNLPGQAHLLPQYKITSQLKAAALLRISKEEVENIKTAKLFLAEPEPFLDVVFVDPLDHYYTTIRSQTVRYATESGHESLVEMLLDFAPIPNTNQDLELALYKAIDKEKNGIVELLLKGVPYPQEVLDHAEVLAEGDETILNLINDCRNKFADEADEAEEVKESSNGQ